MTGEQDRRDVLAACRRRATALAAADRTGLTALLHADFRWSTHTGQRFDRAAYLQRNTDGTTVWRGQELLEPEVAVAGDTAVVVATAVDTVVVDGREQEFQMPVTLTWVRTPDGWRCLAGHAGPRL